MLRSPRSTRTLVAAVLAALPLAALTQFASADTVRLRSGDLVEGKVEDLGDRLRVATAGGDVSVRWKDVECVLRGKSAADLYSERRAATDRKDPAAVYALGLWASRAGLPDEARKCFEETLALDADHEGARDALAQQKPGAEWVGGSRLLEEKGFVAKDGQWMLREEAEARERMAARAKELTVDEKKVEALLEQAGRGPDAARKFAADALAKLETSAVLRPALRALRRGEVGSRVTAARLLGRVTDDRDILRPLIRSAVMDRDRDVRFAAAAALREIGDPDVVKPIARAMWSSVPDVRTNAVESLGQVGGGVAVEWLITRAMTSGGPGPRTHIMVGSQVTYVSDFDVEIAQAAQIGDPIVQTIREGVMLDARVLNVREEFTITDRKVVYLTLQRATGKDFGEDAAAWKKWFDESGRKELTAAAEAAGTSARGTSDGE